MQNVDELMHVATDHATKIAEHAAECVKNVGTPVEKRQGYFTVTLNYRIEDDKVTHVDNLKIKRNLEF